MYVSDHALKTPEQGTTVHEAPVEQRNTKGKQNTEDKRNNGTNQWQNNGIPKEHLEKPTEHQRNTSGTSWNNGTIQNEEQLQYFQNRFKPHFDIRNSSN